MKYLFPFHRKKHYGCKNDTSQSYPRNNKEMLHAKVVYGRVEEDRWEELSHEQGACQVAWGLDTFGGVGAAQHPCGDIGHQYTAAKAEDGGGEEKEVHVVYIANEKKAKGYDAKTDEVDVSKFKTFFEFGKGHRAKGVEDERHGDNHPRELAVRAKVVHHQKWHLRREDVKDQHQYKG